MTERQPLWADTTGQLFLFVSCDRHKPKFSIAGKNRQWYMGLIIGGRFHYTGDDGAMMLEAGDFLLIRPGTYHRWTALPPLNSAAANSAAPDETCDVMWSVFQPRPHWSNYLQGHEEISGFIRHRLTGACFRRTRRNLEVARRSFIAGGVNRDRRVLLQLERVLLDVYEAQHWAGMSSIHVQRAVEFIHHNAGRPLCLEEIAAASCISVSFLMRIFRRDMGITPMCYAENIRLLRAQDMLLHSHYPIAQIASLLGYEHPAYFTARFRKATGVTPQDYRKIANQRTRDELPMTNQKVLSTPAQVAAELMHPSGNDSDHSQ